MTFVYNPKEPRRDNDSWRRRIDRLEESIKIARDWDDDQTLRFLALSLSGEAGELANKVKKLWRSNTSIWDMSQEEFDELRQEVADVRMLIYRIGYTLGLNEDSNCDDKIDILNTRQGNRELNERA